MEITGSSCTFSFTGFTFGTSISRPNSITCAVSMKMMSRTRTTSTSGTILISAREEVVPRKRPRLIPPDEFPSEKAMLLHASFGVVQELEHEVFHARAKFLDGVPKQIVENCGGNGSGEPHRGGNQGLGD